MTNTIQLLTPASPTIMRLTLFFPALVFALATHGFAAEPPQNAASRPAVWLYPPSYGNGERFRELFEKPDAWRDTRGLIDGIGYADHKLNKQFSDDDLHAWLPMIAQWKLKLSLEVGGIKPWAPTGEKIFAIQRQMWDRFALLGGQIDSIAMDEPLCCARQELKKPDAYAVEETAQFIALVRKNYPKITIGDIEPYPFLSVADQTTWIEALEARLKALGVRGLDFYRVDVDWIAFTLNQQGSWREVRKLEEFCRKRSLPFSLVYWASGYPHLANRGLADDATWYTGVMQQGYDYASVDGRPDELVIESWIDGPSRCVPDDADFTFTRSARDFVRKFGKR